MSMEGYYMVMTGNWHVRVKMEDLGEFTHIEAGTRAIEAVFGKREFDENCEMVSLFPAAGGTNENWFDPDTKLTEAPQFMFSIITAVCHVDMYKAPDDERIYFFYLTRTLFANGSQPSNVILAWNAEQKEPDKVKKFLELQKKQLDLKAKMEKPKKKRVKKKKKKGLTGDEVDGNV